jgi:T5SS/PEP-CTERM-associated repeat protein
VQARQVALGAFGSESGTGTLDVTSGGRVDVLSYAATPYQGLRIADGPGTTGNVTVSGEGSALVSRGAGGDGGQGASRIIVGRDGDGTLDVTDGGYVAGFFFEVGRGQDGRPGSGTLNISGEGSLLKGSDEFGTFRAFDDEGNVTGESPDSTFMRIGREAGAEGEVNVTDGGTLLLETDPADDKVFPGMRLGQAQGAVGTLTVDGEDSEVRIVQNAVSDPAGEQGAPFIELGGDSGDSPTGGTGLVTVSNGATIALIGNGAAINVGEGDPGEAGAGDAPRTSTLTVESGGTVRLEAEDAPEGAFMDVGLNAGSDGAVTVTGDGSELALVSRLTADAIADGEFASVLTVGRTGTGVLDVRDGGRVTLDAGGALFPGLNVGRSGEDGGTGEGRVTVSGAGSVLEIAGTNDTSFASSGFIVVGRDSGDEGSLLIEDGGRVALTGPNTAVGAGTEAGASGTIAVTGAGSALEAGSSILISADDDTDAFVNDGVLLPDEVVTAGLGEATLRIAEGGAAMADQVYVGENGTLDADGTLAGDTVVFGALGTGDEEIGALDLDGDLSLEDGARLELDVEGGDEAQADSLAISGDADFNLGGIEVDLDAPGDLALPAEGFVIAEVAGELAGGTARVGSRTALLDLAAEDGRLILRPGTAVSQEQAETVALLFEAALDRDGEIDPEGLNFWIDEREAGLTERELAGAFLEAPEFEEDFGDPDTLSDEAFLGVLYENILDREGEQAGIDFWAGILADPAVTREEILLAFAVSPENVAGSPEVETLAEVEDGIWAFA